MPTSLNISITHFLPLDSDTIVGKLASGLAEAGHAIERATQIRTWSNQATLLKLSFPKLLSANVIDFISSKQLAGFMFYYFPNTYLQYLNR
jgi:hypothetical protein